MASSIKRFENTDHASSYAKYRPSYEGSGLVPKILDYLWGGEKVSCAGDHNNAWLLKCDQQARLNFEFWIFPWHILENNQAQKLTSVKYQ